MDERVQYRPYLYVSACVKGYDDGNVVLVDNNIDRITNKLYISPVLHDATLELRGFYPIAGYRTYQHQAL